MRSTVLLAGLLFALSASSLFFIPGDPARAAATWVEVRAPFSGQWNKFGYAPPSSHPVGIWGGDWATDYYQTPNAAGYWYAYSSSGSSVSTSVALVGNTCAAAPGPTPG